MKLPTGRKSVATLALLGLAGAAGDLVAGRGARVNGAGLCVSAAFCDRRKIREAVPPSAVPVVVF